MFRCFENLRLTINIKVDEYFVKNCTKTELITCQHPKNYTYWTTIKEAKRKKGDSRKVICGEHRFCKICGDRNPQRFVPCKKCKEPNYCNKEIKGGRCKYCRIDLAKKHLKRALRYALMMLFKIKNQENIIEYIADYTVNIDDEKKEDKLKCDICNDKIILIQLYCN